MERIDPLLIGTARSKQAIAMMARLRGNSRMAWLACGLALGWLAFAAQLSGQELRLEMVPEWEGKSSGFSYHLAGAEKPMTVELPVTFSGGRPTTIRLGMDVAKILAAGDVVRESESTHSRSGDSLAAAMKARVSRSFRVKTVRSDL